MIVRTQRAAERGGFTLMEMLVVMAILVVLAGTAVPIYLRYLDEAKKDRARVDVKTLTEVVETYKLKWGDYPLALAVLAQPTQDGGLPYVEATSLLDPWGHEYQYNAHGSHNAHVGKPDIWSLGQRVNDPNGIIGNWSASRGVGGQ
jgi:general secretion pathway protein G